MQTFDFYTDESRKAVAYEKNSRYYNDSKCEGDLLYLVDSVYSLSFISEFNNTTTYNRTISSNVLVLSTEEAVTQLGCAGMAIGSSIDLLNPEDIAKCDREKLSHIIEDFSFDVFNVTIINIQLNNPDYEQQLCSMTNVNNCYAVYPHRIILYIMYTFCTVIVVVVCVVYAFLYKRKPTLPITQPQTEVKPEDNEGKPRNNSSDEKDVSPTLSPSDEVPNTKEPTVVSSVADVASS